MKASGRNTKQLQTGSKAFGDMLEHGTRSLALATLKLLTASIANGLYGVSVICSAYYLTGYSIRTPDTIAGLLIIYAVYTFDRAKGGEEDDVNRKELTKARKDIAYVICALSFLAGTLIFFLNDLLFVVIVPLMTGCLYSVKVKAGGLVIRLKGGRGIKNLIVALTWGVFVTGIVVRTGTDLVTTTVIFLFVFIKDFTTTVMYDFRDIEGDRVAGLATLPICLGDNTTRILLISLHLLVHTLVALAMVAGVVKSGFVLLLSCLIIDAIFIFLFSKPIDRINARVRKTKALFYSLYKGDLCVALGLQIAYSNLVV